MSKIQMTVTLETDLISILDKMAETEEFRGRSHVVEVLLNKGLKKGDKDGADNH